MSTDTLELQENPTQEMSYLLQCKSAGAAHQFGEYVFILPGLTIALKTIDGTGLDTAEIKLATKQRIVLPMDLQE